jgi:hypothetical protein
MASYCDERSKVVFLESSLSDLINRVGMLSLIKRLINYIINIKLGATNLCARSTSPKILLKYTNLKPLQLL